FSWRLQNTYHRIDGSVSKKCTCYINICWPKTDSNPRVTTFEPGYKNHNLNTLTAIFVSSYRSLPESVMNRIKFYVNNSPGMGSFMIRNLLIAEFPQQIFLERDVINAIQYFKQDNSHSKVNDPDNDAFWLLEMLENQQKEDPRMFIAKKIYQERHLSQSFTAGMMSTQRVEGINAIIKKYINSQSSLVDFFQGIQSFLHNQATKAEYRDWIESLPHINILTSASQQIFLHIIKELKKYFTSELYFIQKVQLDVSLEYNATLFLPEEYNSIVIENNENIDSNVDDIQVDTTQISLSNSTSHFVILLYDQGHICTCLMILNRGLVCRYFFQVMISSQQAQFSILLIKRRWFKLKTYGNAFNDSENS
ncbi:19360_t:CDS:2, partial [Rhizophagus irregularis]